MSSEHLGKSGYSRSEELANTLTAGIGLLLAALVAPAFLHKASQFGDALTMAGTSIFLATLLFMYATSTLYHALPERAGKHRVRLLDHAAIYLLIAGTYTPLIVGPLRASGGLALFLLEWGLAFLGIATKIWGGYRWRHVSNLLYIGMGWAGLFWARVFIQHVPWEAFLWVLGGGIVYTVGTVFYLAKHRAYTHVIWHLFVFGGSCCHAYAIWRYILPGN